jgi:hypothetical protein
VDALCSEEQVSVEVIRLAAQLRDVVRQQESGALRTGSIGTFKGAGVKTKKTANR